MNKMSALTLLLSFLLCSFLSAFSASAYSQTARTSEGTSFVFGFSRNYHYVSDLAVYVTSKEASQGVLEIPGRGFFHEFSVPAGGAVTIELPAWADLGAANVIENRAVFVNTDKPAQVYAMNRQYSSTDAYMVLPERVLGKEYLVLAYTGYPLQGQLLVVATQNNTSVVITPLDQEPINLTLNKGQTYLLSQNTAYLDYTGTTVTASAPVAVTAGVQCAYVVGRACDHLVEMFLPTTAWGKTYYTYPLATRKYGDLYRVQALEDNTQVTLNGDHVATLASGDYYQYRPFRPYRPYHAYNANKNTRIPGVITASAPIQVMQFSVGQSLDRVPSDPFMMLIAPTEQFLDHYAFVTPDSVFSANFVNVIIPTAALPSLQLDGVNVNAEDFSQIQNSDYSGAQLEVQPGGHIVQADQPFGIYVYGFTDFESYGYPGGLGVKNLNGPPGDYQNVRIVSHLAAEGLQIKSDSFATQPVRVEVGADNIEIEWRFDTFSIGQREALDYDVVLVDPVPGERREVVQRVEIEYEDLNGVGHRQILPGQYVDVLSSVFDVSLNTDRLTYSAGQSVSLFASFTNLSEVDTPVIASLQLLDADGQLVADLGSVVDALVEGSASVVLNDLQWGVGSTYPGRYYARINLLDASGLPLGTADAPFQIVTAESEQVAARISVDKTAYSARDTARLYDRISNPATVAPLSGMTAQTALYNDAGEQLWQESAALPSISAQSFYDLEYQLPLHDFLPGEYQVSLVVLDNEDVMRASSHASLVIESSEQTGIGLSGNVAINTPLMKSESTEIDIYLANQGNAAFIDIPLSLAIIDPGNEEIIAQWQLDPVNLEIGAGLTISETWQALNVTAGVTYGVVLTAQFDDVLVLDQQLFTVDEKLDGHFAAYDKGRILALVDGATNGCQSLNALEIDFRPTEMMQPGDQLQLELFGEDGALLETQSHVSGSALPPSGTLVQEDVNMQIVRASAASIKVDISIADLHHSHGAGYRLRAMLTQQGNVATYDSGLITLDCRTLQPQQWYGSFNITAVHSTGANDPHGPLHAPTRVAQHRFLRDLLHESGWSYTLVDNVDDFTQAFSTGEYQAYALFQENINLPKGLEEGLVEAVQNGAGLLASGYHDKRNWRLEQALGVSTLGKLVMVDAVVPKTALNEDVDQHVPLTVEEHPLRAVSAGATMLAEYSPFGGLAIAQHQYGAGTAVFVGFDLLAESTSAGKQSRFANILRNSLTIIDPQPAPVGPGNIVPLQYTLTNHGAAVTGQIVFALPPGSELIDAGAAFERDDGVLVWPFALTQNQTDTWHTWLRLPVTPGDVPLNGIIYIRTATGQLIEYGVTDTLLSVPMH